MSGFALRRRVVAAALLVSTACYSHRPVIGQTLPAGAQIIISINDAGRAALGGQLGPEISDIEGRLISKDSAEYVMAVSQLLLLRGGRQVWSGERIRVKTEFISIVNEKRFSKTRTAMVSGLAVGAVALLFQQGLLGIVSRGNDPPPMDTITTTRIPRFKR